ncbi:low temperature requirement protein A [Actinokineospora guangxiensis]|uniref:Low temperature requirement protein A n=1 Tax=Actinokineospora guangxiensis TaxID=1490288 RepID=A0ABW0EKK9_9PSEU
MSRPPRLARIRESSTATTLELFFDLVFVFAMIQVTALVAEDPSWHRVVRGLLLVAVLWWCWVGYSWLSNLVRADVGLGRVAVLLAMAAMFTLALAIPEAFDDLPGGLHGPTVLAFAYLLVRAVHLLLFFVVARDDPGLRRQLVRWAPSVVGGTALLLIAGQTSGTTQTLLWAAAVLADYGGTLVIGASGWRLNSARHFAERHGLILIIALGESIISIGVGVNQVALSWPILLAALLGLSVSASLWWAYFDTQQIISERALARARGAERAALARSAFTFLHLPLVAGVVLLALGLKKVLNYVGGTDGHTLADPLHGPPLWSLTGGLALCLFAAAAISWRCDRARKPQRVGLGLLLLGLTPLLALLPALAALAVVAVLMVALNAGEWVHYREHRARVHAEHELESHL